MILGQSVSDFFGPDHEKNSKFHLFNYKNSSKEVITVETEGFIWPGHFGNSF